MANHTGRPRLWRARAAAVLALISAVLLVLSDSGGRRPASARTPPPDSIVIAWGINHFGQRGDDSIAPRSKQVAVVGEGSLGNVTSLDSARTTPWR